MDMPQPLVTLQSTYGLPTRLAEIVSLATGPERDAERAKRVMSQILAQTITIRVAGYRVSTATLAEAGPDVIDDAIDWLLSEERSSAADLAELQKAMTSVSSLIGQEAASQLDDAARTRCESLRDKRWELMASQAERDIRENRPTVSLENLRANLGLD